MGGRSGKGSYANTTKLKQECVDQRFDLVSRGCAPYVEYLGIQENPKSKGWAAGAGYGEKILKILDAIKETGSSQAGDGSPKPDETKKELYFPKTENIIAPARNRRIKKEWNGYNSKELAEKYNLTTKQIGNILKDEPMIGQMSIFDMNNED